MNNDNKLTVKQFSELAGVSAYTVRRWIKESVINATKERKGMKYTYLIEQSEIDKIKSSDE